MTSYLNTAATLHILVCATRRNAGSLKSWGRIAQKPEHISTIKNLLQVRSNVGSLINIACNIHRIPGRGLECHELQSRPPSALTRSTTTSLKHPQQQLESIDLLPIQVYNTTACIHISNSPNSLSRLLNQKSFTFERFTHSLFIVLLRAPL